MAIRRPPYVLPSVMLTLPSATQNVLDSCHLGKQDSGFSDEDVSDIICLLYPHSEGARRATSRIADENSVHIYGRHDADTVNVDLSGEDDAGHFQPQSTAEHAIILRLSAQVRDPSQGFTFGRNPSRCDIVFHHDPLRRLSNIHFRIYVNEYGVVMLEDTSTNGTIVDGQLLKRKTTEFVRRTLNSGSIIKVLMHESKRNLEFLVRIPRREGRYDAAYKRNLEGYFARLGGPEAVGQTIMPDPAGHLNLFPDTPTAQRLLPVARVPKLKNWDGSGKYNISATIGKGAFATVHLATQKVSGCPYAAKELEKRCFMKNGILDQKVENEMRIMQSVQHRNIVKYIEHFDWNDHFIIIMEYVPLGDLGHYIVENGPLKEHAVQSMSVQLLEALEYLHGKKITHRDIKPDNILINQCNPFVVKLTDFGLSKMVDNEGMFLQTFCGTLLYCAPEVYVEYVEYDESGNRDPSRRRRNSAAVGQRYDHAVDIWSLGGVLFYCLTGAAPYPVKTGISYMELLHMIMTTNLDVRPLEKQMVTIQGIEFLQGMINRRPELRAPIQALLHHQWLGGDGTFDCVARSLSDDEISDDGLHQSTSQLTISQDHVSDSDNDQVDPSLPDLGEEKENHTFGPHARQGRPRLFGEVGISALRSSGAIPAHRLNLHASASASDSMAETDIIHVIADSESESFSTPHQVSQPKSQDRSQAGSQPLIFSMNQEQEVLDDIEPRAESQSLGCADGLRLSSLNMHSVIHNDSVLSDLTSSKRKPLDGSAEDLYQSQAHQPSVKRLKGKGQIDTLISDSPEEFALFASIPQAESSRRQIETPVHKSTFWNSNDRRSWHLRYPEMVNSQYTAFVSAARQRGEEFGPGKSLLWELAMKYFPPSVASDHGPQLRDDSSDGKSVVGKSEFPAQLTDAASREPFPEELLLTQAIATIESTRDSVLPDIFVPISTCFASFGRENRNSCIYANVKESRIPKNAFKILLWRPGFDSSTQQLPWLNSLDPKENKSPESLSFHLYISTKATHGITVNGTSIPSHESTRPGSESKHWVKLQDADRIVLWKKEGHREENVQAVFRCSWSGSSLPRTTDQPTAVESPATGRLLDEACNRTERAYKRHSDFDRAMERAKDEMNERRRNIQVEIERKNVFELKRQEALRNLAMRSSRPTSPVPGAIRIPTRFISQHRNTPTPAMFHGVESEE